MLARRTGRAPASLAADAIADFVAQETATLDAIEQGRRDAAAGRVSPHEAVMAAARSAIAAARRPA